MKFREKFLRIFVILLLVCPVVMLGQSNIAISADAGLVAADKNYGSAIVVSSIFEFDKFSLEAKYLYSELDERNENITFRIYKYSLNGGYVIVSNDRRFKMSGNVGPALLYYRHFKTEKPVFGFDVGLKLSYELYKSFSLEVGVANSFNKTTSNFIQTFCGFRYDLKH